MREFTEFVAYILSSIGLTVLLVWPKTGPSAWLRERVLRPLMPGKVVEVLDCYICSGFWCGLCLSPVFWAVDRAPWCWSGCVIVPGLFWILLRPAE